MRISSGLLVFTLSLCALDLPELPRVDTGNFLQAIRAQIERAETDAGAHPRDAKAIGALGMTLHAYQRYDSAARVYSRAHLLEPENFDWLYLLGAVEMELGDFDFAVKSFQSALRLRPGYLVAELRLAQGLTALSKWDEASLHYQRILDRHADCAQCWYGLGRVQGAHGDHAGAAQSYAKACDLFPQYGMAHFALASELRRLGKRTEAEQQVAVYAKNVTVEPPLDDPLFRRIHELNQSAQAHMQRGAELEKAGEIPAAILEQEAALEVDPANVQAHVNLISLYGRTGDAARARQHFDEATRLNPGRSDAWYNYGVLLTRDHRDDEAEQAFHRTLDINPNYAEAHNNLGAIYEQRGRLDDAAIEFRRAIEDQPDYPLARFHLGRILTNQEKYEAAIQQFLRALQPEEEQTTVYLYALAATYARARDREHALTWFRKARDRAMAHGQSQLLTSIDRDLKTLGSER